jgi:hypothetical protein
MGEVAFNVAGDRQGNGMGTAWERHGMCESALRLPDSMTSALESGRLSAIHTGRLYPQDDPGTHFKRLSRPRAHGIVGYHGKNLP